MVALAQPQEKNFYRADQGYTFLTVLAIEMM